MSFSFPSLFFPPQRNPMHQQEPSQEQIMHEIRATEEKEIKKHTKRVIDAITNDNIYDGDTTKNYDLYNFKSHGFDCLLKKDSKKIWHCFVTLPKEHPYFKKTHTELSNITVMGKKLSTSNNGTFGFTCGNVIDWNEIINSKKNINRDITYKPYDYAVLAVRDLAQFFLKEKAFVIAR